jgi:MFS family permease
MTIPLGLIQFLASAPLLSLGMGFLTVICSTLFMAPLNAATQSLVPSNMRGFTSACVLVVTNIIGLGLGPLAVGALSDQLIQIGFADLSLRYALSASLGVSFLAGCSYMVAARFLTSEWPRASMPQEFELPVQATAINSR